VIFLQQKDAEVKKLETSLREISKCRDELREANESLRKQARGIISYSQ